MTIFGKHIFAMWVTHGVTRAVLVTPWFVMKVPHLYVFGKRPWPTRAYWFISGMSANLYEKRIWEDHQGRKVGKNRLARVLWCAPFGLLLLMESCPPVTASDLKRAGLGTERKRRTHFQAFSLDDKPSNYGFRQHDGKIVLIDYASAWIEHPFCVCPRNAATARTKER